MTRKNEEVYTSMMVWDFLRNGVLGLNSLSIWHLRGQNFVIFTDEGFRRSINFIECGIGGRFWALGFLSHASSLFIATASRDDIFLVFDMKEGFHLFNPHKVCFLTFREAQLVGLAYKVCN